MQNLIMQKANLNFALFVYVNNIVSIVLMDSLKYSESAAVCTYLAAFNETIDFRNPYSAAYKCNVKWFIVYAYHVSGAILLLL